MAHSDLQQTLGAAYHQAQVGGDRAGAIAALRKRFEDDPVSRETALAEYARLLAFLKSPRGMGRGACHISKLQADLLYSALS